VLLVPYKIIKIIHLNLKYELLQRPEEITHLTTWYFEITEKFIVEKPEMPSLSRYNFQLGNGKVTSTPQGTQMESVRCPNRIMDLEVVSGFSKQVKGTPNLGSKATLPLPSADTFPFLPPPAHLKHLIRPLN
jgi:hypothetical protein